MSFPWLMSFVVGFLSLSQEILWVRVVSFAQGGTPMAFSFVLTLYLLGIALGAAMGKRLCGRGGDLYGVAAWVLLLAAVTDPLPPLIGPYIGRDGVTPLRAAEIVLPALGIVFTSALKSILFPIAHHLGSYQSGAHVGSSVSRVYFGNILGSTLGPIVTGFWLLDQVSLDQAFAIVGGCSLALAIACAARSGRATLQRVLPLAPLAGVLLVALPTPGGFVAGAANMNFLAAAPERAAPRLHHVIENKQGVIHTVASEGRTDDVVYGGNMFDGRVNVDVHRDTNGIARVYVMAALHEAPRRALLIGFSAGAWAMALGSFPTLTHVDAIDINPGYLELIRRYPQVSPLLSDPRMRFHVDDGRRWLRRNVDERYDLVVMNNTLHHRAYSTNLLSVEFMRELKTHMNPGAILAYNATGSKDAALTTASVYAYTFRHASFIYASDEAFVPAPRMAQARLARLAREGRPLLGAQDFAPGGVGDRLVAMAMNLRPVAELFAQGPGAARVITDINLLTEYRHGQRPPLSWLLPPRETSKITDSVGADPAALGPGR